MLIWIATRKGFFSFSLEEWQIAVCWYHVLTLFGIYFVSVSVGASVLGALLKSVLPSPIAMASWMNFLISALICCLIVFYCFCIPRGVFLKVWRRDLNSSYLQDFRFAAFAWLISFLLTIFVQELSNLIVCSIFHIQILPDQLAVRFLKMTFKEPLCFLLTTVTIVGLAPIIEETLFRGFLQSFIRKHLGPKHGIFITSVCFSFFHYSPEQGLSNIPIIISLFVFALFLGFVYDKRGSLPASIALHAYFNAINVFNLYFLGGFPKGSL